MRIACHQNQQEQHGGNGLHIRGLQAAGDGDGHASLIKDRADNGHAGALEPGEALEEIGYDGYYNYEIGLRYGDSLKDAVNFLGKYLREFTEKHGRV